MFELCLPDHGEFSQTISPIMGGVAIYIGYQMMLKFIDKLSISNRYDFDIKSIRFRQPIRQKKHSVMIRALH